MSIRGIPEFFEKRIRSWVFAIVSVAHPDEELRRDMLQEAFCTFLSLGPCPPHQKLYEEYWKEIEKPISAAVRKLTKDAQKAHASLDAINDATEDDTVFIERSTEDVLWEEPTWIPSEPSARMSLYMTMQRIMESGGQIDKTKNQLNPFRVRIRVCGAVFSVGRFKTKKLADAGLVAFCKRVQLWCEPIFAGQNDGGTADDFMRLHVRGNFPLMFYGDPVNVLVFLEEYQKQVKRGHRYYVESVDYDTKKLAQRSRARHAKLLSA